ncbi:transposase [Methylocystis parvus]|uniref:Transposase n=1 Tax=Methylocystis parvus TaxID=134 RepID=A0A6B8M560_9HYPH|nr:transposase [Methylocystis parvus]QGM98071.1 transposase [Methylocystis parvus]WBK01611.1 transposase [Methylocystis parvus OBBP]
MEGNSEQHIIGAHQKREDAMRHLLAEAEGASTKTLIEQLKSRLGVSRATAYRMMKSFRTCGAISSASRSVGRPKGARSLDPQREQIIETALAKFVAEVERPPFSVLVLEITKRCCEKSLRPPNWRTIRARLRDMDERARAADRQRLAESEEPR